MRQRALFGPSGPCYAHPWPSRWQILSALNTGRPMLRSIDATSDAWWRRVLLLEQADQPAGTPSTSHITAFTLQEINFPIEG